MTALSEKLARLTNVTMRVKEFEGDVIFLHEVARGAADRSYGVQVARLAGLPGAVVERAREVLNELEQGETTGKAARLVDDLPLFNVQARATPAKPAGADKLLQALSGINPDEMTPREALDALYRLKAEVETKA
jgi:DNA mismatch repair protein MutS